MIYKLTYDEVLNVCGTCKNFIKGRTQCLNNAAEEPKPLKEIHHCKIWDEHFKRSCVYQN